MPSSPPSERREVVTVETPQLSDVSPTTDAVRVKEAGEGTAKIQSPFESFTLPSFSQEEWDTKVKTQGAPPAPAGKGAAKLIDRAKQFIGTPYKWGGSGPLGFDCSGFTQYLYREMGIDLPRVSFQQAASGPRISLDKLRPGDLVAWDNSSRNNGADHIAIYVGDGKVSRRPSRATQ